MKQCPNCRAELDDNARFCLSCMTSLDEKEQIPPPVRKARRWPLVLLSCLLLGAVLVLLFFPKTPSPESTAEPTQPGTESTAEPTQPGIVEDGDIRSQTVDGVKYTFRPATKEDHPTAIFIDSHFVLIRVEGTPSDGIYRVPSFVGDDTAALVSVVADGAFAGTDARAIDLGYNVRYVWGNAFGGYPLSDLYLHEDVLIDQRAFSGCTEALVIHCPDYLENTKGDLWCDLAAEYGFRWQSELF